MKCLNCSKELTGKQTMYCSRECKNKSTNNKHKIYQNQQQRGLKRKTELMMLRGGKCEKCGYNKNFAALCFHHLDPAVKETTLTMRECANNKMDKLLEEVDKCILLCHNCHMEIHYPNFDQ